MIYCQNCGRTHNNTACPYCHGCGLPDDPADALALAQQERDRLRAELEKAKAEQAEAQKRITLLFELGQEAGKERDTLAAQVKELKEIVEKYEFRYFCATTTNAQLWDALEKINAVGVKSAETGKYGIAELSEIQRISFNALTTPAVPHPDTEKLKRALAANAQLRGRNRVAETRKQELEYIYSELRGVLGDSEEGLLGAAHEPRQQVVEHAFNRKE